MSVSRFRGRSPEALLRPVCHAVADCAWITVWAAMLAGWMGDAAAPSGWWILGLILAGRAVAALTTRTKPRLARTAVVVLAGILALLLAARTISFSRLALFDGSWVSVVVARPVQVWSRAEPVDLVLLVALVAWIRGTAGGRNGRSSDGMVATFTLGLIALGGALLVGAVIPGTGADPSLEGWAVVGLLGAGLLSVALARIDEINAGQRDNRDAELHLGAHWATTLGVVLAVMLGVALALSGVLTFDRIDVVFRLVGDAFGIVLFAVVYAIALPTGYLIQWFVWLVHQILGKPVPPPHSPTAGDFSRRVQRGQQVTGLSPDLVAVLQVIAGALILALIAVVLYRSLGGWTETDRVEGVPEQRDFVAGWADLRAAAWRWIRGLFRRTPLPLPEAASYVDGLEEVEPGRRTIREIYREFLKWGRLVGMPRAPTQTPFAYARRFRETVERREPAERLTRAYVAARYGEELADDAVLAESRRALEELRESLLIDKRPSG